LLRNGNALLDLVQGTGFAISSAGAITTIGAVPCDDDMQGLLQFLSRQGAEVFATDHLAASYPDAESLPEAAGILAVPLGGASLDMIVWFRADVTRTVTWAGDPSKPVETRPGLERLSPRRSFEAWTQELRGRSRAWEPHEVAAATGLRDTIVDLILRRSKELEQINASLARSNEELEAFAFVASHDLREPLRQIETFSSLLRRALAHGSAEGSGTARWFEGIEASSKRMRNLINDLTEYARLGRHARPFTPTDLAQMVAEVRTDLDVSIDATNATFILDNLPVVMCDQTQLRQVFQNLISNALKYRHPDRPTVVHITAAIRPVASGRSAVSQALEISMSDNGIGFEERHRERIFEPFQRLHSMDDYEGSGIGLAICRKIINRHGGAITAAGHPGEGAVFTFTLPLRPLPGLKGEQA
jgi:light-regulated signal transduction histidine kinase (bacteriophytochrome)